MILEATATVTGFAAEAVLMKSITDTMYADDVPAFAFMKRTFWDTGRTKVPARIRRRTVAGDWMWLSSQVVEYVASSSSSNDSSNSSRLAILEETILPDTMTAATVARAQRILALLVAAVETAWQVQLPAQQQQQQPRIEVTTAAATAVPESQQIRGAMAAIRAAGFALPAGGEEDAGAAVNANNNNDNDEDGTVDNRSLSSTSSSQFDPNAILEMVREGPRLDFGTCSLTETELNVIAVVLAGQIPREVVNEMANEAFAQGQGLEAYKKYFGAGDNNSNGFLAKLHSLPSQPPPPLCVLNFSYCYIGNAGMDILSQALHQKDSQLRALDLSFCSLDEKGIATLAKALSKRKCKRIPSLRGLILSGNIISPRGAKELGSALAPLQKSSSRKRRRAPPAVGGYETDSDDDDDDDDDDAVVRSAKSTKGVASSKQQQQQQPEPVTEGGLALLHLANTSMKREAVSLLLQHIGQNCTIRELNLASNYFGSKGVGAVVQSLSPDPKRGRLAKPVMPFLDRLDISNNNLANDGTTEFTRVIPKRTNVHFVELKLSSNSIGPGGIQTMMDRLLHHNIVSLSLDKNFICDQGCQLVAASLQSMKSLSRLNLGFNHIGGRGISSLMRSLVSCKSITYLGLSGNVLHVSGAVSLSYALSQHPRMEELDLDNCCLGRAAQCHIVAGIISNRWVPMKKLSGFAVAPPMAAIGALPPEMGNASNSECFRIRKDEQMKTMLQWIETNRDVKRTGNEHVAAAAAEPNPLDSQPPRYLSPDYVSKMNAMHGTPSQSAYLRMLGWLSRIPFDDDELATLQKYFYEVEGCDGDGGTEGPVNLKLRGDLLAALDAKDANDIREDIWGNVPYSKYGSIGLDLEELDGKIEWDARAAVQGKIWDPVPAQADGDNETRMDMGDAEDAQASPSNSEASSRNPGDDDTGLDRTPSSSSMRDRNSGKVKPRISLFPLFETKLQELKKSAEELIDGEEDLEQQHIILTQYAEASLSILRQLRYHSMNSGFDGWPQSGQTRKILVVDDSQVARKLVGRAFEKANYIVDTACDGKEGVEKMKASIYDIAFMDIGTFVCFLWKVILTLRHADQICL